MNAEIICDYCQGDEPILAGKDVQVFVDSKGGIDAFPVNGMIARGKVNLCPMCGRDFRKLEESHCGEQGKLYGSKADEHSWPSRCFNCNPLWMTKEDAISLWNSRVESEPKELTLGDLGERNGNPVWLLGDGGGFWEIYDIDDYIMTAHMMECGIKYFDRPPQR